MKYNFIIPYRNRKQHLHEYIKRFTTMLRNVQIDAEFYIIHQCNTNDFNRGALMNIGFLEVCKTRSDGLFIFHDVDLYPTYWGSISYDTSPGTVRHPIGLKHENLGGICCFWKSDFESINGFPNYWGWGIEDVTLMQRVKKANIPIDESNFVDLKDSIKCFCPRHVRDENKEEACAKRNTQLYHEEMESGLHKNGLYSIQYTILSSISYAPRYTMLNVDFTVN